MHRRQIKQDNRTDNMDNKASQTTDTEAIHVLGAKNERALNQRHASHPRTGR